MTQLAIGIDFGTNSVRALVADCADGREVATAVVDYPSGEAGILLDPRDPNLARQNPADYLDGLRAAVRTAVGRAGASSDAYVGIGVDTTGSTPIPVDASGTALAMTDRFRDDISAQAWLWKDHTAHAEAAELTETARSMGVPYLAKCGEGYSSEWYWSKILRCKRVAPGVFDAAASWVELADFIPAQITGRTAPNEIARGICAAGHKAMYHTSWGGPPSEAYLAAIDPALVRHREAFLGEVTTSDRRAGGLAAAYAEATGLPVGLPVAVGAVDAHLGAVGAGIEPGTLVKIIGTSTCDILVGRDVPDVPGVCGVVPGSVIPGLDAVEAGQSAVGDIFNWFVKHFARGHDDPHAALTRDAAKLEPGESGLLALDWNNGNRNVLIDPLLTGAIIGTTLHTTAAETYRALVEATAFGALMIIERCETHGVAVERVVNCGGIAEKNEMAMQIYADVCNRPMAISPSSQTCALGAAICGAVAGGVYADVPSAQAAMTAKPDRVFTPDILRAATYAELFELYRIVHDGFGLGSASDLGSVMKRLIAIRDRVRSGK